MKSEPRSWRLNSAKAVVRPARSAISTPVGRVRSSPCQGSNPSKTWWRIPVPRVSVRNSVRKPISPRAGTTTSIPTQPVPWLTSDSVRPFRRAKSCVTMPTYSSGASIETRSIGSWAAPAMGRGATRGLAAGAAAVGAAGDDAGLADGDLEALAAHLLDEHLELKLAAALHLPRVGPVGGKHAQRDVADELLAEARLDQARRHLVALAARERRRVQADGHGERRLVDRDGRQGARVVRVGERLADADVG